MIRLGLGERLNVMLENRLPRPDEYTSIHWHGCRLPNNQDGVPYLVQKPVLPGEKFRVELAHFTGVGEPRSTSDFDPAPLHAVQITEPDLDKATHLGFVFGRTDEGQMLALADNGPGGLARSA